MTETESNLVIKTKSFNLQKDDFDLFVKIVFTCTLVNYFILLNSILFAESTIYATTETDPYYKHFQYFFYLTLWAVPAIMVIFIKIFNEKSIDKTNLFKKSVAAGLLIGILIAVLVHLSMFTALTLTYFIHHGAHIDHTILSIFKLKFEVYFYPILTGFFSAIIAYVFYLISNTINNKFKKNKPEEAS